MSHQHQSVSRDEKQTNEQATAAMRPLTTEELREVVGGPVIDNGGIVIAPAATPNVG